MSDCIFCKIIEKQIPAEVVFENESVLAFKDITPSHEVHILFIPKKHVDTLIDKGPAELDFIADLYKAAAEYAKSTGLSHHRTLINSGEPFQEVFHVHLHLLSGDRVKSIQ